MFILFIKVLLLASNGVITKDFIDVLHKNIKRIHTKDCDSNSDLATALAFI
jgi:hypothetical protein